jgi:TetR/AcrR family transcriptional regulator
MRAGRTGSPHLERIVNRYMRPVFAKLTRLFEEGKRRGEFRDVAPEQFVPSMIAVVVFYFAGAPMMRMIMGGDPLSPERIAARRVAVLDIISAALFRRPQARHNGPARREGRR